MIMTMLILLLLHDIPIIIYTTSDDFSSFHRRYRRFVGKRSDSCRHRIVAGIIACELLIISRFYYFFRWCRCWCRYRCRCRCRCWYRWSSRIGDFLRESRETKHLGWLGSSSCSIIANFTTASILSLINNNVASRICFRSEIVVIERRCDTWIEAVVVITAAVVTADVHHHIYSILVTK